PRRSNPLLSFRSTICALLFWKCEGPHISSRRRTINCVHKLFDALNGEEWKEPSSKEVEPFRPRETIMTSEIFSSPFVASSVQEERKPSLWGPFVNAIMISRGQKAEDFMREYLLRHPEYLD